MVTREGDPMTASAEWIGMTDRARLITLFDAAAESACDVVLWERDEPEAATTLVLWAASRHLPTEQRGDAYPVISVETSRHRRIDVFLRTEAKAA